MEAITFLTPESTPYKSFHAANPADIAVPDRPSEDHVFNRETFSWEIPVVRIQAKALEALQKKRLDEEYAGPLVEVDGRNIRFPSTVKDETRLNSLAGIFAAAPAATIPDWKVAQGVYVTMTAPLLQQVKTAGFAHIAATFSIERAKAAAIEACQTAEDVAAWMETELHSGWPGQEG